MLVAQPTIERLRHIYLVVIHLNPQKRELAVLGPRQTTAETKKSGYLCAESSQTFHQKHINWVSEPHQRHVIWPPRSTALWDGFFYGKIVSLSSVNMHIYWKTSYQCGQREYWEYKNWVICLLCHSFARVAHLFACSTRLVLLALIRLCFYEKG